MPIYEYKCQGCGREWESMSSVGDRDTPMMKPCPKCKKMRVVRDFRSAPVTGVDATVGPGADFKELARKMGRGLPKSARQNMERAASLRGRKYGAQ